MVSGEQPSQSNLSGSTGFAFRDVLQEIDHRLVRFARFRSEARDMITEVGSVKLVLASIFPVRKPKRAGPSKRSRFRVPPTKTVKTAASHTPEQQTVIDLSNTKWDWMADKKVDALETFFDDNAMFTHMGGTWGKTQELATM
jgi:hypothetical protein